MTVINLHVKILSLYRHFERSAVENLKALRSKIFFDRFLHFALLRSR